MSSAKLTYALDGGHTGVRLSVLAVLLGGAILGFTVIVPAILSVLQLQGLPELCFALAGGLAIGVGGSWLTERLLRRIWPSGYWLALDDQRLELGKKEETLASIRFGERVNIQAWHFVVQQGRSWVPRGWYCLALHLLQDNDSLVVYTFVKPSIAESMPQWPEFEELISRKRAPRKGEDHKLQKIGEQNQLRLAERERWDSGREMVSVDFIALAAFLDAKLDNWPLSEAHQES